MNKILFSGIFLTFVLVASASYAQDAAEPAEDPQPVVEVPVPAPEPAPAVSIPQPVPVSTTRSTSTRDSSLSSSTQNGVRIHVRQEQGFDANQNNYLEPGEVKAFLKSIYEDSANGPVKNTSDVLYWVDTNGDGNIDRSEASVLSRYSI